MNIESKELSLDSQKRINFLAYFLTNFEKVKIICNWEEIIQAYEPYAYYLSEQKIAELGNNLNSSQAIYQPYKNLLNNNFNQFFIDFWKGELPQINNSKLIETKNSFDFYEKAPFLSLAQDLKEILQKSNKIEKIIFLTFYDKRKIEIFNKTFGKFNNCELKLISEKNKIAWIKNNISDFDIFIESNPLICENLILEKITVFAPYYPIKKYNKFVYLFENNVSDLKKEDFLLKIKY